MQCIWRRCAKHALHASPAHSKALRSTFSRSFCALSTSFDRNLLTSHSPPPTPSISTPNSSSQSFLTPAQISLAASQAVRLSIANNDLPDAFLIVNSIRYAGLGDRQSSILKFSGIRDLKRFKASVVPFDSNVSPRLSSHALLHGLIRVGLSKKAGNLAQQMIESGIRIRSRTLEAVFQAITHPSLITGNITSPLLLKSSLENSNILTLKPAMANHHGTKFALRILHLARQKRQKRTSNMFRTLMTLCVINGEIIIASLLFGIMVRDWQARMLESSIKLDPSSPGPIVTTQNELGLPAWYDRQAAFPPESCLHPMLDTIDQTLSSDATDEGSQLYIRAALQALANIAVLLDEKRIPFESISPIIRSLSACPRAPDKVWVPDKAGRPEQVEAYSYFHDVLGRLTNDLPTRNYLHPVPSPKTSMLPAMDRYSYNSLLQYALRHRRSGILAEKILRHMTVERVPPLKPDEATSTILLRNGTLLRRSEVVDKAWNLMRDDQDATRMDTIHRAVERGDNHTITTTITHLTSTGRPDVVIDLLPVIFPGLLLPSDQAARDREPTDPAERKKVYLKLLKHAVKLGPYVFTSILNALQKIGRTGLTERVWKLAKDAELASWWVDLDPEAKFTPWCLPIHAYTIMIKLYAAEASRGSFNNNLDDEARKARHARQGVIGWGRPQPLVPQTSNLRDALGRDQGLAVYHSVQTAAQRIPDDLIINHSLQPPKADAHFFNAILDIVGRHSYMRPRRQRWRQALKKHQVKRAKLHYAHRGALSNVWDPTLLEIGKDMIQAGFAIPLGFQHLFVGRLPLGAEKPSPDIKRIPYAFPREVKGSRSLYRIPTTKTKGSPMTWKCSDPRSFRRQPQVNM
ncbi:hypothetical protein K443DRAFT_168386 [Laccaria amethystina LaAM-08-1]|jgi:hypothetical protein|uniref:Uncharacterized protein n=1 Tax=Laccaria amethystina LaAM-08-1 TaxID=1095629 RepID=A0A0C9Y171_9AGAR|nr:hypothetical protein K443DRAFT_168386 [Laccaria amethystina LaAM-08-1]